VRADSAGIGDWHVGLPPDPRAIQAAQRAATIFSSMRGRQFEIADFARFGWILAMDEANLKR
jgi:protein-tyrosine phosphatase